ncbi:MAG: sulfate ABC transporter ATP-binding protein, partial [Synechococcaceae bacterium WBB_34_004]|nr:sulfate ABC transporter ATP-binding protein [Synechococcaceae bacterium WBB_34_004]
MGIRVSSVTKIFGDFRAVDDVSVDVDSGSLVALLGPSGSGKSTLLRLIAGLEQLDQGRIWITGEEATARSVQDREVGFVFQHFALFKHRTVRQNVAFGLELRRWKKEVIRRRVDELLELVQLQGYGSRYPSQLSGGQRQRVALARALAVQPRVLLLDEPFSALDAKVRKELRAWLRNLHDEMHVTTVIVTHDQEEAMEVADKIVVMNHGKVEQIGTPAEIYDHPATPFVMSFIGAVNVLPQGAIQVGVGPGQTLGQYSGGNGQMFVRPHDV